MSESEKLLAVKDAASMVTIVANAQGSIDAKHGAMLRLIDAIIDVERVIEQQYGCHADLMDGDTPDKCVIDTNERDLCVYAKRIHNKTDCQYWCPIQEKSK